MLADGLGFSAPSARRHRGALRRGGRLARAPRARARYDSLTALVLVARAGARRDPRRRRLPLRRERRDAAVRQPAARSTVRDIAWRRGRASPCSPATLRARPALAGDRASTRGRARSLGVRSALPDAVLLALVALVGGRGAVGRRRAARDGAARRARPRRRGWCATGSRPGRSATVALAAAEGIVGLWLSVELNAPPGAGDRRARRRRLRARRGRARCVSPRARRGRRRRWPLLAAGAGLRRCGAAAATAARPRQVVATTTQLGDFARAVGGDGADGHQILQAQHRPARVRAAARRRRGRPRAPTSSSSAATGSTRGWARSSSRPAATPAVVDLGAGVPVKRRAERGPEASRYDPHWWHDPRNVEAAVRGDPRRAARADPGARGGVRAQRRAYLRAAARARRGDRAPASARVPAAERKLVTDHDAFGYFADRYGDPRRRRRDPVADDAGPAVGGRRRQALRGSSGASASGRSSPRARSTRSSRARSRARPARARTSRSTATRSGRRAPTARPTWRWSAHNADAMVRGFTGGARGCPIGGARDALVRADGRWPRGYGGHAPSLDATSRFELPGAASGSRVLGPNGGGKTTLFRVLLGELAPAGRDGPPAPARFAVVPQTERSRLDFPVSALDVALMGALSRLPWWRRPGRADRARARERRSPRRARRPARRDVRRALGRPAPARAGRARARAGRAGAAARRAVHAGSTRRAPSASRRCSAELAGEGRGAADRHARRRAGAPLGRACCASTAARSRSARRPRR